MSVMFASRQNQTNSGYLLDFKAGRSTLHPGSTAEKRKVVADKAKGMIFIQQTSDQLMHFCWRNRDTGAVTDDLIIFPGDTEFVPIKECTDGRVYMLKFKLINERRIYWMQGGKQDRDEEYCKKVNDILNNPPPRATGRTNSDRAHTSPFAALAALGGTRTEGELGALDNLDESQLMQLLSLMNHPSQNSTSDSSRLLPLISNTLTSSGESSAQIATPSNTPSNGLATGAGSSKIELSQLREIIASLKPGVGSQQMSGIELSDVLNADGITDIVRNNNNELIPLLPEQEGLASQEELETTLRTPQFRQAVDLFGYALQTGELAPVLRQFGLQNDVVNAAATGDLAHFSKKLTESEQKEQKGLEKKDKKSNQSSSAADEQIAREADEEETNESVVRSQQTSKDEPKTEDDMDVD